MARVTTRASAGNTRTRRRPANAARAAAGTPAGELGIRTVRRQDLDQVIAIDAGSSGVERRAYWLSVFRRYGDSEGPERHFLVAERDGRVVGFVIGEVRDWEFGEPPCGWVFLIDVAREFRLTGVATRLLAALRAGFRRSGVRKLRTILARDNTLILSFFRSQGMMTGPFIPLEMDLDG